MTTPDQDVDSRNAAAKRDATPAQRLCERLLAIRDAMAAANDQVAAVLASIVGGQAPQRPSPEPAGAPGAADYRRFFPAVERLVTEIETEARQHADQAAALDRSF
jgi:hypothetical protein